MFVYYPTLIPFAELEYVGIKVFHCNPEKSYESLVEFVWDLKITPHSENLLFMPTFHILRGQEEKYGFHSAEVRGICQDGGTDVIVTVQDNQEDSTRIYEPKFLA